MTNPVPDSGLSITLSDTADEAAVRDILLGLMQYSEEKAGPSLRRPLVIVARSSAGGVVGGLSGRTAWGWLFIDDFWLAEQLRHRKLGHSILAQAEQEAMNRGCHSAWLDTFSFHGASAFYQAHGYRTFGQLEDYPVGHRRMFMQRKLVPLTDRP